MQRELRDRHERRLSFLRALYRMVEASVSAFVSAFEVAASLGLDRGEAVRILEYLEEKGLVKVDDYATGMVRLTAEGVDRVELGGPG